MRPFLKWAGGKTRLLDQFEPLFPPELRNGQISTYVEPFVGAGAVFIHVAQHYRFEQAHLFDKNPELCLAFRTVKNHHRQVIQQLEALADQYLCLNDERRERLFYSIRETFNSQRNEISYTTYSRDWVERTAYLIFLNKTCYNGLYRVNRKGEFNAPFGRYSRPAIVDAENLSAIAGLLKRATIHHGDFESCIPYAHERAFIYFDPPYRPLSRTSNFTSYLGEGFGEPEQQRLARFFARLDTETGAKLMLSNSDPNNADGRENVIEKMYAGYGLSRVYASRMINAIPSRRGKVSELCIRNYGEE